MRRRLRLRTMTRAFWDQHHAQKMTLYPSEEVVRFLAYAFPREEDRRGKRALDLGAGSGRHTVLLSRWGFKTYAADYSWQAGANARRFLGAEGLPGHVVCGGLNAVPFRDASFDVVLPWECIFYGDRDAVRAAVAEVARVLKPGGLCFTNLRSPGDKHVEESAEIAPGVFLNRGEWAGLVFTTFTEEEARALFAAGFEIIWFDGYVVSRRNGASRDAGWTILARKR